MNKLSGRIKSFRRSFGRLPNTGLVIGVTVLSGLGEGIGLAMFIPLLEIMRGDGQEPGKVFQLVTDIYQTAGVPVTLSTLLAAVIILVGISLGFQYLQRLLTNIARNQFIRDLRLLVTTNVFRSQWPYLSRQSDGELVNRLMTEATLAGSALQAQAYMVAAAVQVLILAIVSTFMSWELILLCVAFVFVVVFVALPLLRKARRLGTRTNEVNKTYAFHAADYLKGARQIKATSTEEQVIQRLRNLGNDVFVVYREIDKNSALLSLLMQSVPVLVFSAIILIAHEGLEMRLEQILVFLILLARMAPRVIEMQQRAEAFAHQVPALGVVDDAIATAVRNAEPDTSGGARFDGLRDRISFEDVNFVFEGAESPALAELSLDIERNSTIAIVGHSGAGKTTLVDLIAALRQPTTGRITVDGIDLREINAQSWRRRIGYVSQDITIFNDTLRNNLTAGCPDASDECIAEAIRIANLTDVVAQLPQGLDTPLNEGGLRLSGGQRQRLALARALVGSPEILVLDEATSALDHETERAVQIAIQAIQHKLTTIIITHRFSILDEADTIYILDHGRIVDAGTYQELMARKAFSGVDDKAGALE